MGIANLFNTPANEQEMLVFSFSNADQHRLIVNAIAKQKGIALTSYLLDPLPPEDIQDWLAIHQQAHIDFRNVLGIPGTDLTSVDFRDPEQFASWSRLHGTEHLQAATMLRLL